MKHIMKAISYVTVMASLGLLWGLMMYQAIVLWDTGGWR